MMRKASPERVAAIRSRVQAVFGELRKMGFICKSNFQCCMTCALAELVEVAEKRRRNRGAYWHRQDEQHFRETGVLFIRFAYLPRNGIEGDTSSLEVKIGEQVAEALREQGLELEWDGDPSKTIVITGITPKE